MTDKETSMSKAVLISIRPEWCQKIVTGQKTIEVRKTRPKLETPFRCYIYCTAGNLQYETQNGMFCRMSGGREVIGEFICDKIYELAPLNHAPDDVEQQACLTREEIVQYLRGVGYGWHISELEIYDYPKKLGDFTAVCRYKNDDETCPSRKIACSFQRYDYNHDGSINLVKCGNSVRRPPQSWRYVEGELWND